MTFPWNRATVKTLDWTQLDLDAHGRAWMLAREEFERSMGHAPATTSDLSAIARRAEAIRKGEL